MASVLKLMAERLPLYPSGRQQEGDVPEILQSHGDVSGKRNLAWHRLSFPGLGRHARSGADSGDDGQKAGGKWEAEAPKAFEAASGFPVCGSDLDGVPRELPGRSERNASDTRAGFPAAGLCRHAADRI